MSVLTVIAAVVSLGANMVDNMKSGADPHRSASFESYEAIKLLHDRVGNMEQMLLTIDEKLGRQLEDFRQILEDENGRQRQIDVWAIIENQRADFLEMGAVLAAGRNIDKAAQAYKESSAANAESIGPLLVGQIRGGPFRLDTAVLGISAEVNMLNIGGMDLPRIRSRAESRVALIRAELEKSYDPQLSRADEMLVAATNAVNEHLGDINWSSGGSWMRPEFSGLYQDDKFVYAACLTIQAVESPLPDGVPRFLIDRADAPTYEVTPLIGVTVHPGEASFCGDRARLQLAGAPEGSSRDERIRIGRENLDRLKSSGFKTVNRFDRRATFPGQFIFGPGTGRLSSNASYKKMMAKPASDIESRMEAFVIWKKKLEELIDNYNNHADLLEVLQVYGATVEVGILAIEDQLDELTVAEIESRERASLDKSLSALSITDVAGSGTPLQATEARIRKSEEERFRQNFRTVAKHADSLVLAGIRRHEAVLQEYERDQNLSKIASTLRMMVIMANTLKTVDEMLEKVPAISKSTEPSNAISPESGDVAGDVGSEAPDSEKALSVLARDKTETAEGSEIAANSAIPAGMQQLPPHRMADIVYELRGTSKNCPARVAAV